MFVLQSGLRPRNPLARLIGWVLGLVAVLGVLALGFFAFIAILFIGAVWMLVNALRGSRKPPVRPEHRAASTPGNGIIDGEFIVISQSAKESGKVNRE